MGQCCSTTREDAGDMYTTNDDSLNKNNLNKQIDKGTTAARSGHIMKYEETNENENDVEGTRTGYNNLEQVDEKQEGEVEGVVEVENNTNTNNQNNEDLERKNAFDRKELLQATKDKYIKDFTTDKLILAEERNGDFDQNKTTYNINRFEKIDPNSLSELKNNTQLTSEPFKLINKDTIYYGSFNPQTDSKEGYGVLLKRGGVKFEGYWRNNVFEPYGRFIYNGIVWEGEFEAGKLNGQGIENSEKLKYEGEFLKGLKNGEGKLVSQNEKFTGSFLKDKKHGNGIVRYLKDGNTYEGEFANGKLNGIGCFMWKNGESYTGNFVNNEMHGKGLYEWTNGDVYEGDYEKGLKSGKGKMIWYDGKIFEGEFMNNKPVGEARFSSTKGKSSVVNMDTKTTIKSQ